MEKTTDQPKTEDLKAGENPPQTKQDEARKKEGKTFQHRGTEKKG